MFAQFLLVISLTLFLHHTAWAKDFGAREFPFLPTLVENRSPELCNAYLAATKDEFFSKNVDMIV
ncbi:MAG: hypothetical protein OEV17_08525, partial [Nitrospira sp.]|nr:hypothetical protein [Nitrospira sp.]